MRTTTIFNRFHFYCLTQWIEHFVPETMKLKGFVGISLLELQNALYNTI